MILEGVEFQGVVSNEDNYNSVPGLKGWYNPGFGTFSGTLAISKVLDLSGNGNDIINAASSQQPTQETVSGFKTVRTSLNRHLKAGNISAFKFLHDGSKHGVFLITRVNNTYDGANNYLIGTALNSATSDRGWCLRHNDTSPNINRLNIQVTKGSGGSALNYTSSDNALDYGTPALISEIFYGNGASVTDSNLYVGNTLVGSADFSGTPSTLDPNIGLEVGISFSTNTNQNMFLLLLYNWTGHTDSDINTKYIPKIKELINKEFLSLALV